MEIGSNGGQPLVGNWRDHRVASGTVESHPQRGVIDMVILDAGLDQPADNFGKRMLPERAVRAASLTISVFMDS